MIAALLGAVLAALGTVVAASSAESQQPGRIVFEHDVFRLDCCAVAGNIDTMNPDGSDLRQLTNNGFGASGVREELAATRQMTPSPELHLQPDADARHGDVDQLLAIIKREQISRFGFVSGSSNRFNTSNSSMIASSCESSRHSSHRPCPPGPTLIAW